MAWPTDPRAAMAIRTLLNEVNGRFPNRNKASDGIIGDAAHQTRDSDHNAWVVAPDGKHVVTAVDITEDAEGGIAEIADLVVQMLVSRKDPRVKYIIHEGRIWRSYDKPGIPAWTSAPYSGPNGHFIHVHVSFKDEPKFYDSTAGFGIYPTIPKKVTASTPVFDKIALELFHTRLDCAGVVKANPGPARVAAAKKIHDDLLDSLILAREFSAKY